MEGELWVIGKNRAKGSFLFGRGFLEVTLVIPDAASAAASGKIKIGPLMWFSRLRKAVSCKLVCPEESPRGRKDG